MSKAGDDAVATFGQGFNCAQAILTAFSGRFGLSREECLKLAAGFGAGMGRMGMTCGAVTGAYMVIGLKFGSTKADDSAAKERTHALVREFSRRFRARHKTLECRELVGFDLSTPQGFEQAKKSGVFVDLCPRLVRDAADIVEEILAGS